MKTIRYGWLAKKHYVFVCNTCRCGFIEENREKWDTQIEREFDFDRQAYVRVIKVRCRCPECNSLVESFEIDEETYQRVMKEPTKDAPPIEELNRR